MANTTWGSGATVMQSFTEFGGPRCGSLGKTRCLDTMCKDDASFKDSALAGSVAIPNHGNYNLTCGKAYSLADFHALNAWKLATSNPAMQWSDASCADMTKNLTTHFNRDHFNHLYLR